jgi:signal transduction histidine kinase
MFSSLRVRLTLLYLMAALALIALVGAGAYWLIGSYFQTTTDLALHHTMSDEFQQLAMQPPPELLAADRAWYARRGIVLPYSSTTPTASERASLPGTEHDGGGIDNDPAAEEAYDGELAGIFVLPLDAQGVTLRTPDGVIPPFAPDRGAVAGALAHGSDLRTTSLGDGRRVRLLTYRLQANQGPAILQIGRLLADQDRVLGHLLLGLLGLGGISAVLLGASSWWLAGRSLRSTQDSWERQQTFVANASHELRTPLTLIRASAEVALRSLPADDADRRGLLGDILHEAEHMSRLVAELLLLSRLDAGQVQVERKTIVLPELLSDVQRQLGRLADERDIRLVVGAASGAAEGDPTYLRQVLLIVLDNALRHTPPGGEVSMGSQTQEQHVEITIADSGSGIAPEDLPHVFERFYRADRARTGGGSGLGLAIAKGLIEAQHGRIRIVSQLGKGTHVTVTLPLYLAKASHGTLAHG